MPRGMSAEETIELFGDFFQKPCGGIQFSVIISSAEYGGEMPAEGVYKNPNVPDDFEHPMFAGIVAENAPGDKAQTLHVFANSKKGARKIHDLVYGRKIKPTYALEEAPPAILKILSKEKRRLIKNRHK